MLLIYNLQRRYNNPCLFVLRALQMGVGDSRRRRARHRKINRRPQGVSHPLFKKKFAPGTIVKFFLDEGYMFGCNRVSGYEDVMSGYDGCGGRVRCPLGIGDFLNWVVPNLKAK